MTRIPSILVACVVGLVLALAVRAGAESVADGARRERRARAAVELALAGQRLEAACALRLARVETLVAAATERGPLDASDVARLTRLVRRGDPAVRAVELVPDERGATQLGRATSAFEPGLVVGATHGAGSLGPDAGALACTRRLTAGERPWGTVRLWLDVQALAVEAGLVDATLRVAASGPDADGKPGALLLGDAQVFAAEPVTLALDGERAPDGGLRLAAVPVAGWDAGAVLAAPLVVGGALLVLVAMLASGCATHLLLAARRRERELARVVHEQRRLGDLLPICAGCLRTRSDTRYWERVETVVAARSDTSRLEALCEDCLRDEPPAVERDTLRPFGPRATGEDAPAGAPERTRR